MIRYGVSDIVITEEESERLPKYATITDNKGNYVAEVEIYYIEDEEDEDEENNYNDLI